MASKGIRGAAKTRAPLAKVDAHDEILRRLKRIEGQVRGVQRMVEQDRACREILDQLSAVQEAVRSVSALVAQKYAFECLEGAPENASRAQTRETVAEIVDALLHAPR